MHEGGGNCVKQLKWGWNRKEGRGGETKMQAGSGGGCLKKGEGLETPYKIWIHKETKEKIATFQSCIEHFDGMEII